MQTKNYSKFCHFKIAGTGPNLAPSKLVQYLKGRSSKLLQDEFRELSKRYWGQYLWA
ncbi:MAG: transposase [Oscillospiraceae bacterium]|nr:transposase [Oscillospiraceae bacterium]